MLRLWNDEGNDTPGAAWQRRTCLYLVESRRGEEMRMIAAVLSGFGVALVAPWISRVGRNFAGWLLALLPLGLAIYFTTFISRVAHGERISAVYSWVPGLNANLSFALDGLSLLFALLITGIGALICIYAGGYLAGNKHLGRFYSFLLFFMASMLGVVLADNLLALFVFWELTSVSSFLLIGFTHERAASRAAARQALMITGSGGLALLVGMIMLGFVGGSFELSALPGKGDVIRASPLYGGILALMLLGAFTKSAQVPFHFWLPNAMEAPTPVSAFLHSATMVKAGVYLLARMSPILGGTEAWTVTVTTVGALTMLVGGLLALFQTDLKRLLAYSTVSALGTLMLLLGLGSEEGIKAMVVFLLAHALYKGALFMVAGAVDHETGTRNVNQLGGLWRAMPITAGIAVLACVSLASFGPVLSFIGKELLFEAVLHAEGPAVILVPAAVLAGALFVTVAAVVCIRAFFGPVHHTPRQPHEAPPSLWLGPAVLALLGGVLGMLPQLVQEALVAPVASAVLGRSTTVELALWHGVNPAFLMSLAAIGLGLGLFLVWDHIHSGWPWLRWALGRGPERWYVVLLHGVDMLALALTRRLQNGYLRRYLMVTLLTTVGLVGGTLFAQAGLPQTIPWLQVRFYEVLLAALMLAAAGAALRASGRLGTVASLGIVGYGVALFYVLYGAPDLAMTQILVETLTVLLFVLAFYHLPNMHRTSSRAVRLRDAVIALLVGGLMTLLVLAATATPPTSRLAPYFVEHSKPDAHGSNIVNVILVDFRGLDTMGEITVLAVAAIGVYALLRLRPKRDA
jgi:multicomponent Na+:H+ antiporter subunit A